MRLTEDGGLGTAGWRGAERRPAAKLFYSTLIQNNIALVGATARTNLDPGELALSLEREWCSPSPIPSCPPSPISRRMRSIHPGRPTFNG